MMDEEQSVNINTMVKNLFHSIKKSYSTETPNMVIFSSKTMPCNVKGDIDALYTILLNILNQLIENDKYLREIHISIEAPEEFLYREVVTFKITNISIKQEIFLPKLQELLEDDLKRSDATLEFTESMGGSIEVKILLGTAELGCRRHYRLPSKEYLNKNILLVVEENSLALSLAKMFKYFPMNIDICIKSYKDKWDLKKYDLVVVEDSLFNVKLHDLILERLKVSNMQFTLLGYTDPYSEDDDSKLHTAYLEKPVTQDGVYQLLLSVF